MQAGTIIDKRQTRKAIGMRRQVTQTAPAGLLDSSSVMPKQSAVGNVQAAQDGQAKPPRSPPEKKSPSSQGGKGDASAGSGEKAKGS